MTTIIVGVDGAERSDDAIALARGFAAGGDAELVLAAAVPYPALALEVAMSPTPDIVAEAEAMLGGKARPLRDAGLAVDVVARPFVSPGELLQALAEARAADLVVLGSTHVSRWGRVLPGSTAERLLHGAPCPVAIAPAGYGSVAGEWDRIGVAFDGSPESREALSAAATLAMRFGAHLEVITVLDVAGFGSPALMGGPGYDRTRTDLDATARRHLDAVVAELPADVHATGRLIPGDPTRELAEASGSLALLVAGSRRYGPLRAVLLGGVTGRLVRNAACPVVITPRGVASPLRGFAHLSVSGKAGP